MRIAIIKSSLRTYSGYLGTLEFKNGFSTDEASRRDCERLKTITEVELAYHEPKVTSFSDEGGVLTVEAEGGGLRYDWCLNGSVVAFTIENTLEIEEQGEYCCVVRNPYGEEKVIFKSESPVEVKDEEPTTEENEAPSEETDAEPEKSELVAIYSREELEALADKAGISGLRDLGDKHDIKGRSIAELIDELLEVKA